MARDSNDKTLLVVTLSLMLLCGLCLIGPGIALLVCDCDGVVPAGLGVIVTIAGIALLLLFVKTVIDVKHGRK